MRRTIQSAPRGEVDGLLDGRYQLGAQLGVGGMATIYRAWDVVLGRDVAVKVLHAHLLGDEEIVERFRLEAGHAAALVHPHIVTVFDQGIDDLPYIVMELVDGPSLRQVLRERGRFSPREALAVLLPVCAALAHAHAAGIVHRDIKPENVLLTPDGSPKVADFGLAHVSTLTRRTTTGTLIGSVHYLAPELIRGREVTPAADQYAVGVLAFELLTARKPLPAETPTAVLTRHAREPIPPPSEFVAGIPVALDRAIRRGTALNPADRFSRIEQFATALRAGVPAARQPADVRGDDTLAVPRAPRAAQKRASVAAADNPDQRWVSAGQRSVVPTLLLALLLLAGFATGLYQLLGQTVPATHVVPSLIGIPEDEARSIVEGQSLVLVEGPREPSLARPEGTVLSQQPAPGTRLRRGEAVLVVLSAGPRVVPMPRVLSMTEAQARAVLGRYSFAVTSDESFSNAPKGVVIDQTPAAGTPVREDTEVRLHISRGKPKLSIPGVPDRIQDGLIQDAWDEMERMIDESRRLP
jgi:hypothetical protein